MSRFLVVSMLLVVLFISGCETFKGVGRDMQKAGNWVEETAK